MGSFASVAVVVALARVGAGALDELGGRDVARRRSGDPGRFARQGRARAGLVANLGSGRAGQLAIGAAPAVSTYVLPAVLKRFAGRFPNIQLSVRTGHSEEVLELVLREQVQVGLVRSLRHPEISSTPLYEE